jgi:hypothetical protein
MKEEKIESTLVSVLLCSFIIIFNPITFTGLAIWYFFRFDIYCKFVYPMNGFKTCLNFEAKCEKLVFIGSFGMVSVFDTLQHTLVQLLKCR